MLAKPQLDRRRFDRVETLRDAKVFYGVAGSLGCVVRDVSVGGARIELANDAFIPGEIFLLDLTIGSAFRSRVVWRRGRDLGLEFLTREDLRKVGKAELAQLRRAWLEHRKRR
jgi:hypothetical protein